MKAQHLFYSLKFDKFSSLLNKHGYIAYCTPRGSARMAFFCFSFSTWILEFNNNVFLIFPRGKIVMRMI